MLVEDDQYISESLSEALSGTGYNVVVAVDGMAAKNLLEQTRPDLILLDLILPDVDGLVLCHDLKAIADVPIIICSATGRKRDTVLGLKLGADDFISKPFDLYELEARLEAVLRRAQTKRRGAEAPEHHEIRLGALAIDEARRRVMLGGQQIHLTPIEYRLVSALAGRPDDVLSREDLAKLVWGYDDAGIGRTVDVHIRRLRVKLMGGPVDAPPIISVRGFGYKMSTDETEETSPELSGVGQHA